MSSDTIGRAIEQAVQDIERELHHRLDAVERIAVERVLERLADAVPGRDEWERW